MFLSLFWCLQWQDLWETWCFHGILVSLVWQKDSPVLFEGGFSSESLYHAVQWAILFYQLVCSVFIFIWVQIGTGVIAWLPPTRSLQKSYLQHAVPSKPLNSLITFALKAAFMADLPVMFQIYPESTCLATPHCNKQKGGSYDGIPGFADLRHGWTFSLELVHYTSG